ncbi:unnamed protein product [Allacma fusca]|uniref:C2H2-type domain-containing protein n=1 Tax=Allacma fusca TaxID=39272 RepID=A0A8J2LEJ0_9HEXA|nr:unnamed protein product [Allacma fusca]
MEEENVMVTETENEQKIRVGACTNHNTDEARERNEVLKTYLSTTNPNKTNAFHCAMCNLTFNAKLRFNRHFVLGWSL